MALFERFRESKEEGFRNEFIRPLLVRLGFLGITDKHGVNEFGKDIVFSEVDRFGNFKHMIVQAKHEEAINQGRKVDDLISQVKQCFNVPYTVPSAPTEQRYVSAVHVLNSGTITDNAETQIRHALPREMATNTHFYSGPMLETLSNRVSYLQSTVTVRSLVITLNQLLMNIGNWQQIKEKINDDDFLFIMKPSVLTGIEAFMTDPALLFDLDVVKKMMSLWQIAATIENLRSRLMLSSATPEQTRKCRYLLDRHCDDAISWATALRDRLQQEVERFATLSLTG